MADLSVTTTAGEKFTEADSRKLATLIFKRFGREIVSATAAWNRMLQNNCNTRQFEALVDLQVQVQVPLMHWDERKMVEKGMGGASWGGGSELCEGDRLTEANQTTDLFKVTCPGCRALIRSYSDESNEPTLSTLETVWSEQDGLPLEDKQHSLLCKVPECSRDAITPQVCATHYTRARKLGFVAPFNADEIAALGISDVNVDV